jgi:hypothetical protein
MPSPHTAPLPTSTHVLLLLPPHTCVTATTRPHPNPHVRYRHHTTSPQFTRALPPPHDLTPPHTCATAATRPHPTPHLRYRRHTTSPQSSAQVEEFVPATVDLVARYQLQRDGCTGQVLLAVYDSVKAAMAAVGALHGQPLAGTGGSGAAAAPVPAAAGEEGGSGRGRGRVRRKGKEKEGVEQGGGGGGPAGGLLWARQVSGEGLHLKRWRLIVPNLPFKVRGLGACVCMCVCVCV